MSFQFRALPAGQFEAMFGWDEAALRQARAVRETVTRTPGTPCRVSLKDAAVGDEVLLLSFVHQAAASPFYASHAIYVRRGAPEARPQVDEVPSFLRRRLLSVRAFDGAGMMLRAEVVDGAAVEDVIGRLFALEGVAYLHVHNAREGCYLARVERG